MTTEKQLLANQQNALLSTGPASIEGKGIVAMNAIKHGIFTKDLIIASGTGKENQADYEELLRNLGHCLSPRNQMESLLVEKIAVDFWRLRRTIRFEAGSISKRIDTLLKSRYSCGSTDTASLGRSIQYAKTKIEWNTAYLGCLKRREVKFDHPMWKGESIEGDITEDFHLIARSFEGLTKEERKWLYGESRNFEDLSKLLQSRGYTTVEEISTRLIEIYEKENKRQEEEIKTLEEKIAENQREDQRNTMMGLTPLQEDGEKALKYERSIQKSIFQNLFLLKKLQGVF